MDYKMFGESFSLRWQHPFFIWNVGVTLSNKIDLSFTKRGHLLVVESSFVGSPNDTTSRVSIRS